jgi:hypothetical protein
VTQGFTNMVSSKPKQIRFSNGKNNDPIAIIMHINKMQLQKTDITTNMKTEAKMKLSNPQFGVEAGLGTTAQL